MNAEDETIQTAAIQCASHTAHPLLEEFLYQQIKSNPTPTDYFPLLQKNATPDTMPRLERALDSCNDPDDLHSAFFSIIRLCKAQYEPAYLPLLYRAYEEGPCSDCRLEVVKLLAHHKQLTPALLQECKFDAVADIRAIAHAYT